MEIGSEFWKYEGKLIKDNSEFWNLGKDTKFVLSGRTAIFYCLKNILQDINVKKVYMPSYSCSSMTQAFKDLGVEVEYYDVYFNEKLKYNIDLDNDADIFFAMNYFGYSETHMEEYIKKFKEKGKIVIEDITHSVLSEKRFSKYSDYLIASLRKWFPISSGAIAVNRNEKFKLNLSESTNQKMIELKNIAMESKKEYIDKSQLIESSNKLENNSKKCAENIDEQEVLKEKFLKDYLDSSKLLQNDYQNYKIDDRSLEILMGINLEEIIRKRKENTKLIYEKLSKNSKIKFLINRFNENDCLLFVPIILEKETRNDLRKYLIENKVFLPVHWPAEENWNNIFEKELSLICDQRYSKDEIEKYLELILNFLEKCVI